MSDMEKWISLIDNCECEYTKGQSVQIGKEFGGGTGQFVEYSPARKIAHVTVNGHPREFQLVALSNPINSLELDADQELTYHDKFNTNQTDGSLSPMSVVDDKVENNANALGEPEMDEFEKWMSVTEKSHTKRPDLKQQVKESCACQNYDCHSCFPLTESEIRDQTKQQFYDDYNSYDESIDVNSEFDYDEELTEIDHAEDNDESEKISKILYAQDMGISDTRYEPDQLSTMSPRSIDRIYSKVIGESTKDKDMRLNEFNGSYQGIEEAPKSSTIDPSVVNNMMSLDVDTAKNQASEMIQGSNTTDRKKMGLLRNVQKLRSTSDVVNLLYNMILRGEGLGTVNSKWGGKYDESASAGATGAGGIATAPVSFKEEEEEDYEDMDESLRDMKSWMNSVFEEEETDEGCESDTNEEKIEEKKADKDYDKDGEVESEKEEHYGSVGNAIDKDKEEVDEADQFSKWMNLVAEADDEDDEELDETLAGTHRGQQQARHQSSFDHHDGYGHGEEGQDAFDLGDMVSYDDETMGGESEIEETLPGSLAGQQQARHQSSFDHHDEYGHGEEGQDAFDLGDMISFDDETMGGDVSHDHNDLEFGPGRDISRDDNEQPGRFARATGSQRPGRFARHESTVKSIPGIGSKRINESKQNLNEADADVVRAMKALFE